MNTALFNFKILTLKTQYQRQVAFTECCAVPSWQ
jgi:hypothetical protein